MTYRGNADIDVVIRGLAAMELAELAQYIVAPDWPDDAQWITFDHMPSQEELDEGAAVPPFSAHILRNGQNKISNLNSTEDEELDTIDTFLGLARTGDDMSSVHSQQQKWVRRYRRMMVKHRLMKDVLPSPEDGTLISGFVEPLQWEPGTLNSAMGDISGLWLRVITRSRYSLTPGE